MVDNYSVDSGRKSVAPTIIGAGVGGVGGYFLANKANVGIPAKYTSWEDAINDTNDEFVKKKIAKGGDNKTAWETIQTHRKNVADARKAYVDVIPEAVRGESETKEYLDALQKYANKRSAVANLAADAKDEVKEAANKELADAKTALKEKFEAFTKKAGDKVADKEAFKKAINERGIALQNVTSKAEKALTEDLLGKCKSPSAKITAIVEDYGIAKYKPMIASLLKNPPLVLPK